jgi:DNA-binding CsgD family transcriptional regulator
MPITNTLAQRSRPELRRTKRLSKVALDSAAEHPLARKRASHSARHPLELTRFEPGKLAMDAASLRNTGIPLIGETDWGTNICLFYETKDDLLKTTVAYFEAGLANHELCVWAVSDPISEADAKNALRSGIADFEDYVAGGSIDISSNEQWDLKEDEFNLQRITGDWTAKLNRALERGYDGLRVSGNASWLETNHWKEFCEYDQEIDRCVAGKQIIVLCTHSLSAQRAVGVPDIVRAHHFTIYRRHDEWKFADSPQLKQAAAEIEKLKDTVGKLAVHLPSAEALTHREKAVLARIVQGESSREIGHQLGISLRTIEFHRANIMTKIGAKNVADLVRIMLGE